jgi:chemotaxis protein MotB
MTWLRRFLPLGLFLAAGCVTSSTFDAKVAELQALRDRDDRAAADREKALKAKSRELEEQAQARRAELERQVQDLDDRLRDSAADRAQLRKSLDDTTALASELARRLERLGQNVDKLASEKGQLAGALDETKARLEELRKQKAAAEAAAATYRSLIQKLKAMIDAGQLKVITRDGRMIIALPNDVLFDSGRTDIKRDAQATLAKVAQVLSTLEKRRFLVAGHTDNVPIHTERFPSNWELSTARAVEVAKFLIARGIRPQVLAAAGHGEYDPVAANDSPERRALNRRIEIILQPNLTELPSIEGAKASGD